MSEQYAELITTFPLFEGFTVNGTKRLIDAGEVRLNTAGQVLLKEGDSSDFVLLVLSGKLEVFVERGGKDLVLTEATPGTILGELAMLCGAASRSIVVTKNLWPSLANARRQGAVADRFVGKSTRRSQLVSLFYF